MRIVVGADHRGYSLKEVIRQRLALLGHEITDVGAHSVEPADDYPDYAYPAALLVSSAEAERAVLVCGSGVGMAITANKVAGIRAVEGSSEGHTRAARRDDDVNVLVLSADELSAEEAVSIVDAFLAEPYDASERHERRLDAITDIELGDELHSSHE